MKINNKYIIMITSIIAIILIFVCCILLVDSSKKYRWKISLQSISKNNLLSSKDAIEVNKPISSSTAITFNVKLLPKTKIVYDVVIQNTGTIDASFDNISGIETINGIAPKEITYKVEKLDGINGDIYNGNNELQKEIGKNYFRVTIENSSNDPKPLEKKGTINFEYIQREE